MSEGKPDVAKGQTMTVKRIRKGVVAPPKPIAATIPLPEIDLSRYRLLPTEVAVKLLEWEPITGCHLWKLTAFQQLLRDQTVSPDIEWTLRDAAAGEAVIKVDPKAFIIMPGDQIVLVRNGGINTFVPKGGQTSNRDSKTDDSSVEETVCLR